MGNISIRDEIEIATRNIEKRLAEYSNVKPNETEDEKLMRVLALSKEQIDERKKVENSIMGHILMPEVERLKFKKK
jgi:hypothetical protein